MAGPRTRAGRQVQYGTYFCPQLQATVIEHSSTNTNEVLTKFELKTGIRDDLRSIPTVEIDASSSEENILSSHTCDIIEMVGLSCVL